MTTHSICFAGLSREEEAEVVTQFKQANARCGNHWLVTPETEAAVVVIDMDSMYGQMSLMKALSGGKTVVALTTSGRTDTDYVLSRPVTADALVALFGQIEAGAPAAPEPVAQTAAEPEPAPIPEPLPEPVTAPEPVAAAAPPAPLPEPVPEAPPPSSDPHLADYLRPGALKGPVRLTLAGAPDLVLDPATQTYAGGSSLKPLLPYCSAVLTPADLAPVDPAGLPAVVATLGGSQPWSRLAWLCALANGNGALAPGYGPNDKYKLRKWPQTEREFPKHFRIATVMMKGPAVLTDIAEQSGSTLMEVIDFVNASLASGVAEPESGVPADPEAAKGGLLGRFRR